MIIDGKQFAVCKTKGDVHDVMDVCNQCYFNLQRECPKDEAGWNLCVDESDKRGWNGDDGFFFLINEI